MASSLDSADTAFEQVLDRISRSCDDEANYRNMELYCNHWLSKQSDLLATVAIITRMLPEFKTQQYCPTDE